MGSSGSTPSIHVANASNFIIRARISKDEFKLKDLNLSGHASVKVGTWVDIGGSAKAEWDIVLNKVGFASIGPNDALEFDLDDGNSSKLFVTVLMIDGDKVNQVCENYTAPKNKSILVTNIGPIGTIKLSQQNEPFKAILYQRDGAGSGGGAFEHYGGMPGEIPSWTTEDGYCYTADAVRRVYRQQDVDQAAKKFREQILNKYSTDSAADIQKAYEAMETDSVEERLESMALYRMKDLRGVDRGLKVRPVRDCVYAKDGKKMKKIREINEKEIELENSKITKSSNEMEIVISVRKQPK